MGRVVQAGVGVLCWLWPSVRVVFPGRARGSINRASGFSQGCARGGPQLEATDDVNKVAQNLPCVLSESVYSLSVVKNCPLREQRHNKWQFWSPSIPLCVRPQQFSECGAAGRAKSGTERLSPVHWE